MVAAKGDVMIRLVAGDDSNAIAAAISLGDNARRTLGHLPFAAYEEAASSDGLLVAEMDDQIVGYALFRASASNVRLFHVCVAPARRKQGVARALVEDLSRRHADRPGIMAWCRHDYGLARFWTGLGFSREAERRGRGRLETTLVAWWRDNGHPSIFAPMASARTVTAAVDLNVLRDLADPTRTDRTESQALFDDQVSVSLELVRTPALSNELDDMSLPLRRLVTTWAQRLRPVVPNDTRVAEVANELTRTVQAEDPHFLSTEQGRADLQYVSEAAAAGIHVFVTRDERLRKSLRTGAAAYGLRLLRPVDVILHLDELVHASTFRPIVLRGTSYTTRKIGSDRDAEMEELVASTGRPDRRRQFTRAGRAAVVAGYERWGIYDGDGQLVAAYLSRAEGGILSILMPVLRPTALAATLERQLLFSWKERARSLGATTVVIEEPSLATDLTALALEDGYGRRQNGLVALVVDVCDKSLIVERSAREISKTAGTQPSASLRLPISAVMSALVERYWWPAKLVDGHQETYIVPIRPAYSRELIGVPSGIFARPNALGLSREQVYYRSPKGPTIESPARLLWYVSSQKQPGGGSVAAYSRLEEVAVATAGELHERFGHLGVWTTGDIENSSRGGLAQALRFEDTEVFPVPIPLLRLRSMGIEAPQAPRRIDAEAFRRLYVEGQGR